MQLQDLQEIWKGVNFQTKNHKEKENQFIIMGQEEMYQYIDEGLATINMILGNRFVKVMRNDADNLKRNITTLSEAFDQWMDLQRKWQYLETIFNGGGTIKQQLPQEAKMFDSVNKYFLGLN